MNNRLSKLESQRHPDEARDLLPLETAKTINLPLDIILKNNVALSYFIDYVTFRGKQAYLFFYLNVEGNTELFKRFHGHDFFCSVESVN